MRLVVTKKSLRRVLRWAQRILLASAVLLLAYCGFVLADTWSFQKKESSNLERLLHGERATGDGKARAGSPAAPKGPPAVAIDGLIGRIEIPRVGLSAIIVEGIGKTALRRAVGHIPGTALPGQPGNVGISGHRDTFFRPLRNIHRDDIITLTTLRGVYRYRVVSTRVVSADDVAELDPTGGEILTLVTCHPFYFVGPAPNRFIVRAERIALRMVPIA
jgi:sortase A